MAHRIITLCYRKVIELNSTKPWEKMVFEDTYQEFRMQAQYYNQEKKYRTFAEMIQHVPGAEKLHFLVSAAITGYVQQLNECIPDVANNLGRQFLRFKQFQFEIINSDLHDKSRHQVAISFYSTPLLWLDTIGTYLLVAEQPATDDELLTHLFSIQPYLSIHSLRTQT
jgi:hypothetical protein